MLKYIYKKTRINNFVGDALNDFDFLLYISQQTTSTSLKNTRYLNA